jgi:hypothetical protein
VPPVRSLGWSGPDREAPPCPQLTHIYREREAVVNQSLVSTWLWLPLETDVRADDGRDCYGYLLTEARIIAKDEMHAVIAVRIEKAWISRNLPFLASIADLTPAPPAGIAGSDTIIP